MFPVHFTRNDARAFLRILYRDQPIPKLPASGRMLIINLPGYNAYQITKTSADCYTLALLSTDAQE